MTVSPEPTGLDTEARAARRTLVLAVVAVLAVVVAAASLLGGDPEPVEPGDPGAVVVLGPTAGAPVNAYVEGAARALAGTEGRRVAVASLDRYLTLEEVRALVDGDELDLVAVALALPGGASTVVDPGEVDDEVARQVADAETQVAEVEALLPTVDDPEFADFYAAELRRYRALVARADAAAVHGAVVRGPAPALRALASRPVVRAVEPGAGDALVRDAVVTALRPEETDAAGTPDVRPA